MTEVPTPRADAIVAEYGSLLDLSDGLVQTIRAEESAPRIEGVWSAWLPGVLQPPEYADQRLQWQSRHDESQLAARRGLFEARNQLWVGSPDRDPGMIVAEEVVIRALYGEKLAGRHTLVHFLEETAFQHNLCLELLPLNTEAALPPLPPSFTLFWKAYEAGPQAAWVPYAVSVEDVTGVIYSEDPAYISAFDKARSALLPHSLPPTATLQRLERLDRQIQAKGDDPAEEAAVSKVLPTDIVALNLPEPDEAE